MTRHQPPSTENNNSSRVKGAVAVASLMLPWMAAAQTQVPVARTVGLSPVVVTATRTEVSAFDVPGSIDRIDSDSIRDGRMQVNISESLGAVPGLLARDRQNYAQDVQLSVRGFGARSTFGIRGVRAYVDGIPATLPDGQGQISNVDLGSADRIEVLRGPFSALYGNSSGGVIQVFTEEGRGQPTLSLGVAGGSDNALRLSTKLTGSANGIGYNLSASRFASDGYRDHSEVQRGIGNIKLTIPQRADGKFTLIANSLALPKAQDPLGLTRAQFDADPRSVDPSALSFDTRKTVRQTQLGAIYERNLDGGQSVRLLVYGGHRDTEQFQSIPTATQASPLAPGGVIDLARGYGGTDMRWTYKESGGDHPFSVVAGLAYDSLQEHRRGFQNFIGSTLGVEGALRRDEKNHVTSFDQYLQTSWRLADRWTLNAGVRHVSVRFDSKDGYIVGTNPDDSGGARYQATLPVVGLMLALNPNLRLYATAGRGFETPTLNELAYRPSGATGLNFGLKPSRSDNFELGMKVRDLDAGELSAAVFQTRTTDEIVTLTNSGGRATFQNAGSTGRRGLELGWSRGLWDNAKAQVAYTWLDARYRSSFNTCAATPCTTPTLTIPADSRLPGVARSSLFAAFAWTPPLGWRGGVEARALSKVYVNDVNSDAAAGYGTIGANVGYVARIGSWEMTSMIRGDNLFARRYAGSVIVNEGNKRYFEPAPQRTWLASVSGSLPF